MQRIVSIRAPGAITPARLPDRLAAQDRALAAIHAALGHPRPELASLPNETGPTQSKNPWDLRRSEGG